MPAVRGSWLWPPSLLARGAPAGGGRPSNKDNNGRPDRRALAAAPPEEGLVWWWPHQDAAAGATTVPPLIFSPRARAGNISLEAGPAAPARAPSTSLFPLLPPNPGEHPCKSRYYLSRWVKILSVGYK
jgi:hypothetical protein